MRKRRGKIQFLIIWLFVAVTLGVIFINSYFTPNVVAIKSESVDSAADYVDSITAFYVTTDKRLLILKANTKDSKAEYTYSVNYWREKYALSEEDVQAMLKDASLSSIRVTRSKSQEVLGSVVRGINAGRYPKHLWGEVTLKHDPNKFTVENNQVKVFGVDEGFLDKEAFILLKLKHKFTGEEYFICSDSSGGNYNYPILKNIGVFGESPDYIVRNIPETTELDRAIVLTNKDVLENKVIDDSGFEQLKDKSSGYKVVKTLEVRYDSFDNYIHQLLEDNLKANTLTESHG